MGNHDLEGDLRYLEDAEYFDAAFPVMTFFSYRKRNFLLVHDPRDVPRWWNGWVIHGHHHWMPEYPFIDGKNKNINVACELVNYTPVSLDKILSLDFERIKKMDTIESEPEFW
jgi:calcineurin-like phosphoesterase family protein